MIPTGSQNLALRMMRYLLLKAFSDMRCSFSWLVLGKRDVAAKFAQAGADTALAGFVI